MKTMDIAVSSITGGDDRKEGGQGDIAALAKNLERFGQINSIVVSMRVSVRIASLRGAVVSRLLNILHVRRYGLMYMSRANCQMKRKSVLRKIRHGKR